MTLKANEFSNKKRNDAKELVTWSGLESFPLAARFVKEDAAEAEGGRFEPGIGPLVGK